MADNQTAMNSPGLLTATMIVACTLALPGCGKQTVKHETHEMLNAALWTQSSAEYAGNALQAYHIARENLDQALADPQWTAALEQTGDYSELPPAIMLDLDQTVLDNTGYNVKIILEHGQHKRESYAHWCRESTAPAIPGAAAFLDYAVERGVTVIYYSARKEALRECTTRNLRELGLPLPDQDRLLLNDGTTKTEYRIRMAQQYRILLLVGDNLEDFVDGSRSKPSVRGKIVRNNAQRWGRQWIILPNPMYGHWESSLYGFNYKLPRSEQLQRKMQQLHE